MKLALVKVLRLMLGMTVTSTGAVANDLPVNSSLIELRSRIFDMRTNVSKIRRGDYFIPIDRVDWIEEVMERDPDLHPTVIHIDSTQDGTGRFDWVPHDDNVTEPLREGIPDVMKLEGYDVRWRGRKPGGTILLIPPNSDDYYVYCVIDPGDLLPTFCLVIVSYPADRDLRIKVRVYRDRRKPLNDFAAIATKARLLVRCILDVTEKVEEGTWVERPYLTPQEDLPEIAECRALTS